jgi:putative glutamine amidotransferase
MPKPSKSARKSSHRPRIGIPWRTVKQERRRDLRYNRDYIEAVRKAGGEPVQVSLQSSPGEIEHIARTLDAFVLPGSPADVNPKKFGDEPHPESGKADLLREKTDSALLRHALPAGKPVLAICYGIQSLNVHLGGSLIQDIPSQLRRTLRHSSPVDAKDATHSVSLTGGDLAELAGDSQATVNSVHHQSVGRLGRGLRVIARAPDGVVEAVEWTAGPGWALGVQWHPERTPEDRFAKNIFRRLVSEAAKPPAAGSTAAADKKRAAKAPAARGTAKPATRRARVQAKATRRAKKAPNKKGKSRGKRKSGRRK